MPGNIQTVEKKGDLSSLKVDEGSALGGHHLLLVI